MEQLVALHPANPFIDSAVSSGPARLQSEGTSHGKIGRACKYMRVAGLETRAWESGLGRAEWRVILRTYRRQNQWELDSQKPAQNTTHSPYATSLCHATLTPTVIRPRSLPIPTPPPRAFPPGSEAFGQCWPLILLLPVTALHRRPSPTPGHDNSPTMTTTSSG